MTFIVAAALGFAISFVGSMPIAGPLAVLVMDRALDRRKSQAFYIALGGAIAEGLYVLGIAVALPLLMELSDAVIHVSRGLGSVMLGIVGLVLLIKPEFLQQADSPRRHRNLLAGLTSVGLNPTLLATWTLLIGTLYAQNWVPRESIYAVPLAIGVVGGTFAWFAFLIEATGRVHRYLTAHRNRIMRLIGLVLVGVSLHLAYRLFDSVGGAA